MPTLIVFALRYWKLIVGGLAALALTIVLVAAKADARHWRKEADQYRLTLEVAKREAAEAAASNAARAKDAADTYAARTAALQPLIVRSTDTVRTYAETDAGRAACLDADRAAGVQRDRADLFAAVAADPTPGGADAVPSGAAADPVHRGHD